MNFIRRYKEPKITVIPSSFISDWRWFRKEVIKQMDDPLFERLRGVRGFAYDEENNEIVLGDDEEPTVEMLAQGLCHEYLHFLFTKIWKKPSLSDALDDIRKKHPELATII